MSRVVRDLGIGVRRATALGLLCILTFTLHRRWSVKKPQMSLKSLILKFISLWLFGWRKLEKYSLSLNVLSLASALKKELKADQSYPLDDEVFCSCWATALDSFLQFIYRPQIALNHLGKHNLCMNVNKSDATDCPLCRFYPQVREYELRKNNFSDTGNFGFGIQEHIDLGIKYDPSIGIYGLDFYVVIMFFNYSTVNRGYECNQRFSNELPLI